MRDKKKIRVRKMDNFRCAHAQFLFYPRELIFRNVAHTVLRIRGYFCSFFNQHAHAVDA